MTSRTRMYFQLAQFNSEYENLMNVFKFEGWNQDNISSITGIRTADLPWRQQAKHQNEDLVIVSFPNGRQGEGLPKKLKARKPSATGAGLPFL